MRVTIEVPVEKFGRRHVTMYGPITRSATTATELRDQVAGDITRLIEQAAERPQLVRFGNAMSMVWLTLTGVAYTLDGDDYSGTVTNTDGDMASGKRQALRMLVQAETDFTVDEEFVAGWDALADDPEGQAAHRSYAAFQRAASYHDNESSAEERAANPDVHAYACQHAADYLPALDALLGPITVTADDDNVMVSLSAGDDFADIGPIPAYVVPKARGPVTPWFTRENAEAVAQVAVESEGGGYLSWGWNGDHLVLNQDPAVWSPESYQGAEVFTLDPASGRYSVGGGLWCWTVIATRVTD